jgi:hypothetical protein
VDGKKLSAKSQHTALKSRLTLKTIPVGEVKAVERITGIESGD